MAMEYHLWNGVISKDVERPFKVMTFFHVK